MSNAPANRLSSPTANRLAHARADASDGARGPRRRVLVHRHGSPDASDHLARQRPIEAGHRGDGYVHVLSRARAPLILCRCSRRQE